MSQYFSLGICVPAERSGTQFAAVEFVGWPLPRSPHSLSSTCMASMSKHATSQNLFPKLVADRYTEAPPSRLQASLRQSDLPEYHHRSRDGLIEWKSPFRCAKASLVERLGRQYAAQQASRVCNNRSIMAIYRRDRRGSVKNQQDMHERFSFLTQRCSCTFVSVPSYSTDTAFQHNRNSRSLQVIYYFTCRESAASHDRSLWPRTMFSLNLEQKSHVYKIQKYTSPPSRREKNDSHSSTR